MRPLYRRHSLAESHGVWQRATHVGGVSGGSSSAAAAASTTRDSGELADFPTTNGRILNVDAEGHTLVLTADDSGCLRVFES
jgi:hypothetical protein